MIDDGRLALFVLLGQTATQAIQSAPETAHAEPLHISDTFDLAAAIPEAVKKANVAALSYKLFFVFENYLRQFVVQVLASDESTTWWEKIPGNRPAKAVLTVSVG